MFLGDIHKLGALKLKVEAAFLSELDSEGIFPLLKEKVEKNQLLSDEELMEFIILPLSYRKEEEKKQKLKETVELAVKIQNRKQQVFTLAGLLVFSDKIMDQETVKRIKGVIEMTQVARIFEEEKLEAVRLATEQVTKQVTEQVTEQITRQMVEKMLRRGDTAEEIIAIVPGYSLENVAAVREKMENREA